MRKLLLLALVPFALATAPPATAASIVSITSSGFDPAQMTVGVGDTVMWVNRDTVTRQLIADSGGFSSPQLPPGEMYTFQFTRPGTFAYHDRLKTAHKGTVVVRRTGVRSVTIATERRVVALGSAVELSGTISGAGGQQVIVIAKPYRGAETRTPVLTESDGSWSLRVRPRIRTEYQAEWGNTMSEQAPIVHVRPAVQLRVLNASSGRLYTKVTALRSFRGKLVTLQRLSGNVWVKVRRVRLGAGSAVRFTARLPRTARVRVLVPSAPGYLQGFSRTALVRR
jgi:plastocyanin